MVTATTVPANLTYYAPPEDGSQPWITNWPGPDGERIKNYKTKGYPGQIENVRGTEEQYDIDKMGFEFRRIPSAMKTADFDVEEKIVNDYYSECAAIIKQLKGASKVVLFDHTIRRNDPIQPHTLKSRKPVDQVHVDQSPEAATNRVKRHCPPEEVPDLLQKRFQILNLWRSFGDQDVFDRPLALCDFRSLNPKTDLVPTTLKYPERVGEIYSVNYSPAHQWKYWRGMNKEEFILIKCYDSISDGSVAVCTPHTSFDDPTKPDNTQYRTSIEVRALVFYD